MWKVRDKKRKNGELCFRHRLIPGWYGTSRKGKVHVTDVSNASRTMLFNIHTRAVGR